MMARRLLHFLVRTNLWISLGAVSMYLAASRLQSTDLEPGYAFLIFAATLFAYTFHRLLAGDTPWSILFRSFAIASITGGYGLFLGAWEHLPKLILPVIVTVSYLLARVNKLYSVRAIDWLKPLSIAFTWAWVSVAPAFDLSSVGHYFTFLYVLGVVWSLCIVFDLKDMAADKARGFITLPQKLTERRLKFIAILIACLSLIAVISLQAIHYIDIRIALYICILIVLQSYFIIRTRQDSTLLWYYGLLDGLLLLPGIIIFL